MCKIKQRDAGSGGTTPTRPTDDILALFSTVSSSTHQDVQPSSSSSQYLDADDLSAARKRPLSPDNHLYSSSNSSAQEYHNHPPKKSSHLSLMSVKPLQERNGYSQVEGAVVPLNNNESNER